MTIYRAIDSCRLCGSSSLRDLLDLGRQQVSSYFLRPDESRPLSTGAVPLSLVMCDSCKQVQIREEVAREALFSRYFYRSGTNPMMREALSDVVDAVATRVELMPGDVVLDIGCNDATMLLMHRPDLFRVGFDPAENLEWDRTQSKAVLANEYFSRDAFLSLTDGRQARAVTTIATLYSMADLNRVVHDVAATLADDGIWCIQVTYLGSLLETLSFNDVCHEHLYYFSLETLEQLLLKHGLNVFDATVNEVNGGSLRVFCSKRSRPQTPSYHSTKNQEATLRLADPESYSRFFGRILDMKAKVMRFLGAESEHGRPVIGLGASTKGNVLLQFFGIDSTVVPLISDRNPLKHGLRTQGSNIAVVSEEEARSRNPATMLVLIWFFREEILRRERAFLEAGGQLLFPMPTPTLVRIDGEEPL